MGAEKLNDAELVHSMPEKVNKATAEEIIEKIHDGLNLLVLDFTKTDRVDRSFFPFLHQMKQKLSKFDAELKSTNISLSLKSQLNADGVLRMFNMVEQKPVENASPKIGIDVPFVTPFINSTVEILKVQANLESRPGKPRTKSKDEGTKYDIIGIISLVSNTFEGSITLCFQERVFLNICESMLGETFNEIDDDIEDAAGELLNIIFGMAKAELNEGGKYKLEKAIPTVIRGPGLRVKQGIGPTIILPFESPAGTFQIEIEAVSN